MGEIPEEQNGILTIQFIIVQTNLNLFKTIYPLTNE